MAGQNSATRHAVTGSRGEKLPADYSYTFIYNETENGKQNEHHHNSSSRNASQMPRFAEKILLILN